MGERRREKKRPKLRHSVAVRSVCIWLVEFSLRSLGGHKAMQVVGVVILPVLSYSLSLIIKLPPTPNLELVCLLLAVGLVYHNQHTHTQTQTFLTAPIKQTLNEFEIERGGCGMGVPLTPRTAVNCPGSRGGS